MVLTHDNYIIIFIIHWTPQNITRLIGRIYTHACGTRVKLNKQTCVILLYQMITFIVQ